MKRKTTRLTFSEEELANPEVRRAAQNLKRFLEEEKPKEDRQQSR